MEKVIALKKAYRGSTVLWEEPMVAVMEAVVSAAETAHIMRLASGRIERAKVSMDTNHSVDDARTGGNCWLNYDDDPVLSTVGQRIADIVGIPLAHAEAMQVIHYGPAQQYKAHYDAYDLSTVKGQRCCRKGGQRLVTALVYLNEVAEGGSTAFPKLGQGLTVETKAGRMVLFHNTADDISKPHPDSLHAGTPVVRGEKWAFNIWFHARPMTEIQNFDTPVTAHSAQPMLSAATEPIHLLVNRASPLWQQALQCMQPWLAAIDAKICMTYWDSFDNPGPQPGLIDNSRRVIRLIDRRYGNQLTDKPSLRRMLDANALSHLAADSQAPTTATLTTTAVSVRLYLLLWQGEVWLFCSGLVLTAVCKPAAGSTDNSPGSNADNAVVMSAGHESQQFRDFLPAQRRLLKALLPVLRPSLEATDADHYLLLAVDTLLGHDGSVLLSSINAMPNFIHSADINRSVNVPFFESVMRQIIGFADARLERI